MAAASSASSRPGQATWYLKPIGATVNQVPISPERYLEENIMLYAGKILTSEHFRHFPKWWGKDTKFEVVSCTYVTGTPTVPIEPESPTQTTDASTQPSTPREEENKSGSGHGYCLRSLRNPH